MDRATAEFIKTTTGTNFAIEEDEEVIDVCRAWKNSIDQAKSEGLLAGREEGLIAGREEGLFAGKKTALLTSIRNLMKNKGWTAQESMDALMISADEQPQYMSVI